MIEINRNNAINIVCTTTIVITVLTQTPSISGLFRPIMYVMWVMTFGIGVIGNRFKMPINDFAKLYLITIMILGNECFLLSNTHSNSYALRIIPLPLMCYMVGLLMAQQADGNTVKKCVFAFFAVSFIMFSYIFVTYIGSFRTWFTANYYIYEQKNSAAQIIGCTIILSTFLLKSEHKWYQVGKIIALVTLFLIIVAMQCRTALVALIATGITYYILVIHGRKKILFTVAACAAFVIVLQNSTLSSYVLKAFVFTERQTKNLDYFTSGRLTLFSNALHLFREHPLVGTGHHRVDDFYLCMLSDVGLIGFIPIITLWLTRIGMNVLAFYKRKTSFTACVLCLTVFYFSESIFEAYPPFGPGVCSFMFWVVCAFLDAGNDIIGIEKTNYYET